MQLKYLPNKFDKIAHILRIWAKNWDKQKCGHETFIRRDNHSFLKTTNSIYYKHNNKKKINYYDLNDIIVFSDITQRHKPTS